MALTDVLNVADSAGYYEPAFRRVLEEHLQLIKNRTENRLVTITPMQALRYKGDFYGLLNEFSVPDYMKWITMRASDLTAPGDANESLTAILLVDPQYVRRIYNTHRTQMKLKTSR